MFFTQYKKPPRQPSAGGSRMQPQYKMTVNKETGAHELKQKGEIDLYAQIQSFKDSTDINFILERYARGDVSALSKIQGVYGDFTAMPTTLAELSQRVLDAENLFYQLPLDVREQFDHNPSVFYASMDSEKFQAIFRDPSSTPQPMQPDAAVSEPVTTQPVEGGSLSE